MIASDVNPLPQSVERIAANFGCKTYYPELSLQLIEKTEIVKDYELRINNNHERDALAAAIKAYRKYKDLFSKIEQTLIELDHMEIFEEVTKRLLKEGGENIIEVVKEILEEKVKPPEPEVVVKKVMTEKEYQNLVERLQNRLAQREEDLNIVKEHSEKLKKTIEGLEFRIKKLGTAEIVDREIERLWHRISILEKEIDELRRANEMMKKVRRIEDDKIPLIDVEDCSIGTLIDIDKKIDLENRIVYCNSSDLTPLNEFGIKALVRKTPLSEKELERLEFPVIIVAEDQIEKYEEIKTIKQEFFEKEFKVAKKTGLVEWLKGYRKRKS